MENENKSLKRERRVNRKKGAMGLIRSKNNKVSFSQGAMDVKG